MLERNKSNGTCSHKRVKNNLAMARASQDARLYQLWRKRCKMAFVKRLNRNRPDRTLVPTSNQVNTSSLKATIRLYTASCSGCFLMDATPTAMSIAGYIFLDRFSIVVILLLLTQQKQVLMNLCRSVCDRFWHAVWLMPDNVTPEDPPIILESKGNPPGYT